jgi:glycosyltransferase involved in cell wall biosynthesis
MKKLRIGMFAWESLYSVKVGGIALHVSELSEALAAKEHEVHIFTSSGGLGDYEQINGVHYHRVTHDQNGGIVNQMDRMCDAIDGAGEGIRFACVPERMSRMWI